MSKAKNTDILGRIVFVGVAAFFMVKYNYEVSQFLLKAFESAWEAGGSFTIEIQRAFDDAGFIKGFFLLIILFIIMIVGLILTFVVGGLVWLAVKLNDLYVLPFILPVLVVYSSFSYSFIVKPILWVPEKLVTLLVLLGKGIGKMLNLFVVLPMAEIISLKGNPKQRLYRAAMSVLFSLGFICFVIGTIAITVEFIQAKGIVQKVRSFIDVQIHPTSEDYAYQEKFYQVELKASKSFWTETGIKVRKGDILSLNAIGYVRCNSPYKEGLSVRDADGFGGISGPFGGVTPRRLPNDCRARGYSPSNYILADKPINCLMGKVGTGQPFYIGSSNEFKIHQNGMLLLGINQVWRAGAWKNNSGKFSISITIKRK
ncbi:MAG: hypothetical protein U9N55_00070 [candidate division Zixibacteria bacterium]|nr:hypothetical protein [candidate division Zixibacteria bacterium]